METHPLANGLNFQVTEGVRTIERQRQLVARGASRTLESRHLADPSDGLSRAVDLAAVESDGDISWQWSDYFIIADVMRQAAQECSVAIRWGGGWFLLNGLKTIDDIRDAQAAYVERKRQEKKKPFLDGPHFELPK